ncbi:amino acid adenylation domain-containing protein [Streptomyces poriferorum]|uniref:non-ribosomal peptide synthetase n=1 Tax=Streptomyces poriferorum TaxID=2798799 RepID=UPI0027400A92|nr:non-ribosomal peptide synthetase [Streptomyces sp. Alt1]WLQ46495.1 amino acid adenylation domain-containing protein [Streptomyces sp. Alt1]
MTQIRPVAGSWTELLADTALRSPDRVAFGYLADGEVPAGELTYARLDSMARMIGAHLQGLGLAGRRVLLLYPSGLDYVAAFFGCLYAGAVAVPAYPPTRQARSLERIAGIIQDCGVDTALTTEEFAARLASRAPAVAGLRLVATDSVARGAAADGWTPYRADERTTAFIQYTSGSTSSPRGVVLSHGNLLSNAHVTQQAFGTSTDTRVVSWLPMYHDMGLIGSVLGTVYCGGSCVLMSPSAFAQRPARWLEAISAAGGTASGGPNFAYDLCVDRIGPEERAALDLSSWEVAFNGAEPLRPSTLRRFADAFADSGFRAEALTPCFGLAEATLLVSAKPHGTAAAVDGTPPDGSAPVVSSGIPAPGVRVEIVDPATRDLAEPGRVGEIWVSSHGVSEGYLGRPELTAATFAATLAGTTAPRFLRTGDLGYRSGGELHVVGRLKDLIIVRGRNHYPTDIEQTVEHSHPALRPGGGAAFSLTGSGDDGAEQLAVVHELDRGFDGDCAQVVTTVRGAVAAAHRIRPHSVVLIRAGSLPRTSSGKVQRGACKAELLAGSLKTVHADHEGAAVPAADAAPASAPRVSEAPRVSDGPRVPEPALPESDATEALSLLRTQLSRLLRHDDLPAGRTLIELGLDSLGTVELQHRIERELGYRIDFEEAADLTLGDLAALVAAPKPTTEGPAEASPAEPVGDRPLTSNQYAQWLGHQVAPDGRAQVIASAVAVRGPLDTEALERALHAAVARHPGLRTTFPATGDGPVRRLRQDPQIDFVRHDASGLDAETLRERLTEAAYRPFDLAEGPLLRAAVFTLGADDHRLVLAIHHIVADLWSVEVLLADLDLLYPAALRGDPPLARPVGSGEPRQPAADEQERLWEYWSRELAGAPALLPLPTDGSLPGGPLPTDGSLPGGPLPTDGSLPGGPLPTDGSLPGGPLPTDGSLPGGPLPTDGSLPGGPLPAGHPRPARTASRGASVPFALGPELSARIAAAATTARTTPYTVLLAGYQILLARLSGRQDLLVATPEHGRRAADEADGIGLFAGMLVLRGKLARTDDFDSLLRRTHRTARSAAAHAGLPLPVLIERLRPRRSPGRPALAQAVITVHRPVGGHGQLAAACALGLAGARGTVGGLALESVPFTPPASQFETGVTLAEIDGQWHGVLHFDAALLRSASAGDWADQFRTVLDTVTRDSRTPLSDPRLLGPAPNTAETGEETAELLPVHEMFARRAAIAPDRTALVWDGGALTYAELDARANRLAHRLREAGVVPESLVALCLPRSPHLVVAVLAVAKAGGAYVPLDPAHPSARTGYVLEDARPSIVLTCTETRSRLPGHDALVIDLDAEAETLAALPATGPGVPGDLDRLAYVIHTSGSSGRPKGVLVPHRGVANLFAAAADFRFDHTDVWTLFHSYAFDFSVWEMWGPLVHGGRLVLVEARETLSPPDFWELLRRHRVTVLNQTPAVFAELTAVPPPMLRGLDLRHIIFGGERLEAGHLAGWAAHGDPATRLTNMYGITEITVHATYGPLRGTGQAPSPVPASPDAAAEVPLGAPLAGTDLRLLDEDGCAVAPGEAGEICIGGRGVVRGYLGQPALTAERFVPHPDRAGERMYRSGDLARQRPDGALEYLGRADSQVKIRGHRIEPGEIAVALRAHPGVRDAFVLADRDTRGRTGLTGYVVPRQAPPTAAELRAHLRDRLPEYLVPGSFRPVSALPLTVNGKVDHRALIALGRAPSDATPDNAPAGAAPQLSPTEAAVAGLVAELLETARVGRDDDLFALGWHSLLMARLALRIDDRFGVKVPLQELFVEPTVARVAASVDVGVQRAAGSAGPGGQGASRSVIARVDRSRYLAGTSGSGRLTLPESLS